VGTAKQTLTMPLHLHATANLSPAASLPEATKPARNFAASSDDTKSSVCERGTPAVRLTSTICAHALHARWTQSILPVVRRKFPALVMEVGGAVRAKFRISPAARKNPAAIVGRGCQDLDHRVQRRGTSSCKLSLMQRRSIEKRITNSPRIAVRVQQAKKGQFCASARQFPTRWPLQCRQSVGDPRGGPGQRQLHRVCAFRFH